MKSYPDPTTALRDALRLAEGMTYKFAVPGLPYGGGKAVLAIPPHLDPEARPDLLRRYGALVHQLGGSYRTAPDVGTCSADMNIVAETGAPYVFARTEEAGGSGSSGPATALGVFTGIQVACEHIFGDADLTGRRVWVQGTGSVGGGLIEHLLEAGARVLFSEVDESAIRHFRDELGLEFVGDDGGSAEALGADCDIFSPCALGGVLNEDTIPLLDCKAIVGGANNQLAVPEDEHRLRERGILYAPDYVVNVGGAMAGLAMETRGLTREVAEREVVESVSRVLKHIFERAESDGITTGLAARRIAEERLSAAG
jgi:glutamate dehydrogenase/leucine dehydrogenase